MYIYRILYLSARSRGPGGRNNFHRMVDAFKLIISQVSNPMSVTIYGKKHYDISRVIIQYLRPLAYGSRGIVFDMDITFQESSLQMPRACKVLAVFDLSPQVFIVTRHGAARSLLRLFYRNNILYSLVKLLRSIGILTILPQSLVIFVDLYFSRIRFFQILDVLVLLSRVNPFFYRKSWSDRNKQQRSGPVDFSCASHN